MRHFFFPSFDQRRAVAGFTLIEAVLAIALVAIFASSLFVYLGTQLLNITESRRSLEALALAQEGMEATRVIRDASWDNFTIGSHGLLFSHNEWILQNTSDTTSEFTRTISITDLSANERRVVSTVSWQTSSGRARSTSLTTNLSNWRNVVVPRLSGNWGNPQTLGTIDLGPGIQGAGVTVRNKVVYMTGRSSSAAKPDFFVINALDGQHPSVVASINTGPGLNAVALAGNFAYVANSDPTNQLQTINISATTSPTIINSFSLTGNTEEALSVAASGTLVLISTEKNDGKELFLIDVANPTVPLIKSSMEIGGDVNRIILAGDRAYLDTSSSTGEFLVVDISNPNVPVITALINLPGTNAATGLYINPQDHRAYITRKNADGTSPEINVYDVNNPDAPSLLGSAEFENDIPAVFAADNLSFIGTNVSNLDFQIFDTTDPHDMPFYSGLNFPQYVNDIAFETNVLYVALRSNDALRIITSQ